MVAAGSSRSSFGNVTKPPTSFDVAVMPNQYGDIMSDLASAVAGSVGLGGGATFGRRVCLFEPVHGTAPDIAGKGIANPVSQILTAALLLRHHGEAKRGEAIERAVADALADPINHTPDLKGRGTTESMTEAIIDALPRHMH
ncbi:isocitrate/isopropylmalate family dehydrogenase [Shumkonia mesophila]|uniref:isocitrate/isopropylmalate family dehydrogenase n=1 Tax=Shumkonia mesophila TaxID=2838854 RepID=UPI002935103D|nr:isocitrate/isopropylmalate family dehydrogenase [Shumkonia mesophila]